MEGEGDKGQRGTGDQVGTGSRAVLANSAKPFFHTRVGHTQKASSIQNSQVKKHLEMFLGRTIHQQNKAVLSSMWVTPYQRCLTSNKAPRLQWPGLVYRGPGANGFEANFLTRQQAVLATHRQGARSQGLGVRESAAKREQVKFHPRLTTAQLIYLFAPQRLSSERTCAFLSNFLIIRSQNT